MDPYNPISLVCIVGAALGDVSEPDRPVPSTIYNVDVTSLEHGRDEQAEAMITEEALRELKKINLAPTVVQPQPQYRCSKLMTLINAQGHLCASIVVIKDEGVSRQNLYKVNYKIYMQTYNISCRQTFGCTLSRTRCP